MSTETPTRRSERSTRRTVKFTDDAFEGLELDLESSSSDDQLVPPHDEAALEEDDRYSAYSDQGAGQSEEEADGSDGDYESLIRTPSNDEMSDDSNVLPFHDDTLPPHLTVSRNSKPRNRQERQAPPETSTRGIDVKKSTDPYYFCGGNSKDVECLKTVQSKWINEITIPSRVADSNGEGGMQTSPYVAEADGASHKDHHRLEQFAKFQNLIPVTKLEAFEMYLPQSKSVDIVTSLSSSMITRIEREGCLPLDQVWSTASSLPSGASSRSGWLLNLCDNVQHLQWAPSKSKDLQYLAVSTCRLSDPDMFRKNEASAVTCTTTTSSAIQIWSFEPVECLQGAATLDMQTPPRQRLVLCTGFGELKDLKWCPVSSTSDSQHIGLLATIHKDGVLRILSVNIDDTESVQYQKIDQVAFQSKPPETVCTALTWLSSSTIAAACANGHVAIWNIDDHLRHATANAPPCFYEPVHNSYIGQIVSGFPSRPHLLATTCVDGTMHLTSLDDSESERAEALRLRLGYWPLIWQDHMQHFFVADDTQLVKGINLRAFFLSGTVVMKQEAKILALEGSAVHTSLLSGSADGSVAVTNPVRRMLKSTSKPYDAFLQYWFKHEWRRGQADDSVEEMQVDFPNGLVQLTTGYAVAETKGLARSAPPKKVNHGAEAPSQSRKRKAKDDDEEETTLSRTIHEKEAGVRSLSWNPNIHMGGWAAAGMASGLVIVEDLAWDR